MKIKNIIAMISVLILAFLSLKMNAEGIKERLAKRLPAINKMKEEGLIGENNKGYLEARKELSDENAKIVEAENSDRKNIYAIFAKKNGISVEKVGTTRALKIAKITKAGVWLQKPDGTWYKK